MEPTAYPDLTLVVPTYNRCRQLRRLLDYYAFHNLGVPILIADSSERAAATVNESTIHKYRPTLLLDYRRYATDIPPSRKIMEAVESVATAFVVLCGDDDFILPPALRRSVDFLREHDDYSAAQGAQFVYSLEFSRSPRRPFFYPHTINYPVRLEHECPGKRLAAHLSSYFEIFYAVQRTDQLADHLRVMDRCTEDTWFAELLLSGLAVTRGKVYRFDDVFVVMERHGDNFGARCKPWGRILLDEHFSRRYGLFRNALSHALVRSADFAPAAAGEVVDGAFERFVQGRLRLAGTLQPAVQGQPRWRSGFVRSIKACGVAGAWLQAMYVRVRLAPWLYLTAGSHRSQMTVVERFALAHGAAA